jgi:hypothetical protein
MFGQTCQVFMNEHDAASQLPIHPAQPVSEVPPEPPKPPPTPPSSSKPFSWWLRKLFACNPFYLVSAALLLFGCYRVSIEAPFLKLESARLLFNFSSVECYEIMLVVTAIFLARRRLWYDSTLLVGLENLLVFVPFILISQAALIDSGMAQTMCLAGAGVALLRFGGLKKYFTQLNLPGRLLGIGAVFLALNVLLPLLYRIFGDTKVGIHIDSGPAYEMNEYTWLLIFPAVLALVNLLPRTRTAGGLLPQHRRLPLGLFSLWLTVTLVHLYGLDFIYQFDLRGELLAPLMWVLAWTLFWQLRSDDITKKYALTFLPLLVPLIATSDGGEKTFSILAALNIAAFCLISFLDRRNRLARHLAFGATLLLVAGIPMSWLHVIAPGLIQTHCVAAGLMVYLIFWTAWLNNPKLAILGAILFGTALFLMISAHAGAIHWALQGGFIFLLLHSLRWQDNANPGASTARILTGLAWIIQSWMWLNSGDAKFWMPLIPGGLVLTLCFICPFYRLQWEKIAVPVAAILVMLSSPGSATVNGVRAASVGLLAIIGSFLLFGLGTLAALTRQHWHKHECETQSAQMPAEKS